MGGSYNQGLFPTPLPSTWTQVLYCFDLEMSISALASPQIRYRVGSISWATWLKATVSNCLQLDGSP